MEFGLSAKHIFAEINEFENIKQIRIANKADF